MPLKVLIVGASIAGPSTAYWFAKAGAAVTVIERFPSFREGGQNIDIRSVGLTVMRRMGIESDVKANIAPIKGFRLVREDGSTIATMEPSTDPNKQALISEFEILRGNLAKIFYDKTKDKVKYIFNEQIATIQQTDGIVNVEFSSGNTGIFDLVVAADGATSRTRALGLECAVRDYVRPLNAFAAYCSTKDTFAKGNLGIAWCKAPGRFYAYGPDDDPTINRLALISVFNKGEEMMPFHKALKDNENDKALAEYIAKRFGGQGWRSDDVAQAVMKSDDLYASEMVQVKPPTLFNGRFALVGDAGYAAGPTGGGTSLAMAGAYILAGEVTSHATIAEGLAAYEKRMQPILKDLQQIPPGFPGIMAPQTEWGLWLRNCVFIILAFCSRYAKYFGWIPALFASSFDSDKYNLPHYKFDSLPSTLN